MRGDELERLHLAEKLCGVASNVACADLVGNDLALGVHDERAALGTTVLFDVDVEVACEDPRASDR